MSTRRTSTVYRLLRTNLIAALLLPSLMVGDALAQDEEQKMSRREQLQMEERLRQDEETRRLLREKSMESIERLKVALQGDHSAQQKAMLMLRLAEAYRKLGEQVWGDEQEVYLQKYDECFNTEGCDPDQVEPNYERSLSWRKKAIKRYKYVLDNFPRFDRADVATFQLASVVTDIGDAKGGLKYYKALQKNYPNSEYYFKALVAIGDYYFDDNNAYSALKAFKKALQSDDAPQQEYYGYALYRLAWCYYNVGEYRDGIDSLKMVVKHENANTERPGGMTDEALKSLVRFYADDGDMDGAIEYFTSLGREDLIRTTLELFAKTLFENGDFPKAVEAYRRLIAEEANYEKCPEYQIEIINAYKKLDDKQKTLDEVDRLVENYAQGTPWANANAGNPEAIANAEAAIEKNLRVLANNYHNEAKKLAKAKHPTTNDVRLVARAAYERYLSRYPQHKNAYLIHHDFGELLYKLKDYVAAYGEYMAVVKMDPKGEKSRFCAESAIFAANEQVKIEGGGKLPKADPNNPQPPQDLTEWEKRLIAASNQYADLFPSDKNVIGKIYFTGELLFNKYRFAEAADVFSRVIAMNPRSREATDAAGKSLNALEIQKDWPNIKKFAKTFYDQENLGDAAFKKKVYGIYENSSFKLIEVNLEADKDKSKAADSFVAFYDEFPESKNAAKSLNNASIYYYDTDRPADSVKVRLILVEDPKFGDKTKYYYDQVAALAYDYETIFDVDNAIKYYEKLWSIVEDEKKKALKADKEADTAQMDAKAGDALYTAAILRVASGDWQQGIAHYDAFMKAYPEDSRVTEMRLTVARVYEDNDDFKTAAERYTAYYKAPPKDGPKDYIYFARLRHGQSLLSENKRPAAEKLYKETVSMYEKEFGKDGEPNTITPYVAEMKFELLQDQLQEYKDYKITTSVDAKQRKQLAKKLELRDAIVERLVEVRDMRAGQWSVAAYVNGGQVFENYIETLESAPLPDGVKSDPEIVEMFEVMLADNIAGMTPTLLTQYETALNIAYANTLYNDDTAFAARRLGELRPNDYPGLRETINDALYTSSKRGEQSEYESDY